jgi:Domain of unknown function (DUF5666)
MSIHRILRNSAVLLVAALALAACGGGGGAVASGGISGTGARVASAVGTVSGFGSIIVNGMRWVSDAAVIVINGEPNRPQSELRAGMVVRVSGNVSADGATLTAAEIDYEADLLGTVDTGSLQVNANGSGSLQVFGQPVRVDRGTLFVNAAS